MGWPKGKKRGTQNIPRGTILVNTYAGDTPPPPQPDLVLTVRRIQSGAFAGLWELRKVLPDGTTHVMTDANTKGIVANLAYNEIARCGT